MQRRVQPGSETVLQRRASSYLKVASRRRQLLSEAVTDDLGSHTATPLGSAQAQEVGEVHNDLHRENWQPDSQILTSYKLVGELCGI